MGRPSYSDGLLLFKLSCQCEASESLRRSASVQAVGPSESLARRHSDGAQPNLKAAVRVAYTSHGRLGLPFGSLAPIRVARSGRPAGVTYPSRSKQPSSRLFELLESAPGRASFERLG